jgi:hypothetical protein
VHEVHDIEGNLILDLDLDLVVDVDVDVLILVTDDRPHRDDGLVSQRAAS